MPPALLFPLDLGEPPVPVPKDGEAPELRVEFKFCFDDISSVDTKNGTVTAKVWIGLAWLDPRLCGQAEFPEDSWTPSVVLRNSGGIGFVYVCHAPKITDSKTGQCYRLFYGEGNFVCAMDLREYPFDHQTLTFVVRSESLHAIRSKLKSNPIRFESYGSMAQQVYPKDPNPRVAYFDDDFHYQHALPEWSFQALVLYNHNKDDPMAVNGVDDAHLMTVKVQVQREFTYYLHKMVTVLVMLTVFTLAVIKMNPISQFSSRMGYVMTVFLAIVAFAFVISSSTPSLPYLTVLDKLLSASYALTFFVGLETLVVALVAEVLGAEAEGADALKASIQRWDRVAVLGLVGLSVVYYAAMVGSRVKGNLNVRDAARDKLDIAVEPRFLEAVVPVEVSKKRNSTSSRVKKA